MKTNPLISITYFFTTLSSTSLVAEEKHHKQHTNSLGMNLIFIPAGTFTMGSPKTENGRGKDEDQVEVTLTHPFYILETEVTQNQWLKVTGKNLTQQIATKTGPIGRGANLVAEASAEGPEQPMCFVNWEDANYFCQKLTTLEKEQSTLPKGFIYSLPTEAQWEYACRGGTKTVFAFGNTLSSEQANFYGKKPYGLKEVGLYREKTTPVKTFPPNSWGLYDMHGNLYEWCTDWYGEKTTGGLDPTGAATGDGRIIRGGTWNRIANSCRSSYRYSSGPESRSYNIGFRVILKPAASFSAPKE